MKKNFLLIFCMLILMVCIILIIVKFYPKTEKLQAKYEGNGYESIMDVECKDNYVIYSQIKITYKDNAFADKMYAIFKLANDAEGNLEREGNIITLKNFHKSLSEKPMLKDEYIMRMEDRGYDFKRYKTISY